MSSVLDNSLVVKVFQRVYLWKESRCSGNAIREP
ncbi:hypothetical protein SLEP1_g55508 [Rubroshorea leprosula]|uniref:Uncharacterized protein n=1 Tax=Rubroshorea leprosula TaxID=152421 RepID=A0AAV5MGQ0_9ROSI|nr:hypothetical protein SLEP1_g55508 [Rubroshorea leprosula]